MLLVQCPQPGKPDAAQLPWEGRALCPWPKCAKANWGGSAAAPLLQAACVTPAGCEAKVTLLKVGFAILEKNSQFRVSSRGEMGWPSSASHQARRDVLSWPGPGAPFGMCCYTALSLCSRELQILSGVSLQWATGSRPPLPHQQQFKLQ